MNILKTTSLLPPLARFSSTVVAPEFVNRNPRNLERMRIARKPEGFHLDKPGRKFWHKLVITPSNRTITAQVVHFLNGTVIEAKTSEWPLRKQLFSIKDTCAYVNLGRVFAQRCLKAGITEMYCDIKPVEGGKMEKLLQEVTKSGIQLTEPERYVKPMPWDRERPEKPWEVHED